MSTTTKKELGQFFSTRWSYVLTGFTIPPSETKIIEPFVGQGDLLEFVKDRGYCGDIDTYDIDPKIDSAMKRDVLEQPPNYTDSFIITNPPYLARNKSISKHIYDMYDSNDLYKCFLKSILGKNSPTGGIIIIPLNFFCSLRESDVAIRDAFLSVFQIENINIFSEKVFDDTGYTVCSLQFKRFPCTGTGEQYIAATFFPQKETRRIRLARENNWMFGGEIFRLGRESIIKVERLVEANKTSSNITNINLIGLDDGRANGSRIRLEYDENHYVGKTTSRTKATLLIYPVISIKRQKELIKRFNTHMEQTRKDYHSLFLTNYRESHDYARKRLSFHLAYNLVKWHLEQMGGV